jgi:hypothetical protein
MPKVFISYRRDDTLPYAGRLCEALMEEFGGDNVFMDIDSISPGRDFAVVLEEAIRSCDVLVVLIGRQWLTISGPTGQRRLDDPADFVRREIIAGLERKITIIPALVQNVPVPRAGELPEAISKLFAHQVCELSDTRWQYDVRRLLRAIKLSQPLERRRRIIMKWAAVLFGIALVVSAGVLFEKIPSGSGGSSATNSAATSSIPTSQTNIIFQQFSSARLQRPAFIKEITLLQQSNNLVALRIEYKYGGGYGANNIVMRAEAFNVRGDKFAGSALAAPVGIGEGTVELRLKVESVWLPLNTTNLDIAFYRHDPTNRTYERLEGETVRFIKDWK